ncbi:MAG: hypothetical protein FWG25_09260 [Promicromonosporaceae bacterium]|nr:hypothetical protein [Promicromonosporaceae bacterium]
MITRLVSGADQTASTGQTDLMNMFTADGVDFSSATWDPDALVTTKDAAADAMIANGTRANFVTWSGNYGHKQSFDFGYTIPAVRDWLFAQTRGEAAAVNQNAYAELE